MALGREQLYKPLAHCKNGILNQICVACGFQIRPRKLDKVQEIIDGLEMSRKLPSKVDILAVDVGVKNFSFCQINGVLLRGSQLLLLPPLGGSSSSGSGLPRLNKDNWARMNLHERYGREYPSLTADAESMMESKRYYSYLSYLLVNDLLLQPKFAPTYIVIENQRTRSNGAHSTLPNVLLNYTLENMLYSSIFTLQQIYPWLATTVITPMNSNKMINFWVKRFLGAEQAKDINTKKIRSELFYNWLESSHAPFTHSFDLPENFEQSSTVKKSKFLLSWLDLPTERNKADDLIDSLLYALTIHKFLENQQTLSDYLEKEKSLIDYVSDVNDSHKLMIADTIQNQGFAFNDDT